MTDMTPIRTTAPKDLETDREMRCWPGCGDAPATRKLVAAKGKTPDLHQLLCSVHARQVEKKPHVI